MNLNVIDIEALNKLLRGLKGKFLLSYDDTPEARKLFRGFKIRTVVTRYMKSTGGLGDDVKELLISNY